MRACAMECKPCKWHKAMPFAAENRYVNEILSLVWFSSTVVVLMWDRLCVRASLSVRDLRFFFSLYTAIAKRFWVHCRKQISFISFLDATDLIFSLDVRVFRSNVANVSDAFRNRRLRLIRVFVVDFWLVVIEQFFAFYTFKIGSSKWNDFRRWSFDGIIKITFGREERSNVQCFRRYEGNG